MEILPEADLEYLIEVTGHYFSAYSATTAAAVRASASTAGSTEGDVVNGVYASVSDIISAVSTITKTDANTHLPSNNTLISSGDCDVDNSSTNDEPDPSTNTLADTTLRKVPPHYHHTSSIYINFTTKCNIFTFHHNVHTFYHDSNL